LKSDFNTSFLKVSGFQDDEKELEDDAYLGPLSGQKRIKI